MTTISPTRVSMYDFLYQDIQPMISLLADVSQLSLPQTRLAVGSGLQAIVCALLTYQQRYQGQSVSKKLFNRSAIKELRRYNSMNFATIDATLYYRHDTADTVFKDSTDIIKASDHIASQIDATTVQVQTLLKCLCIIALRELAILADYSQLDYDEIDKWFALQPQFLSAERFTTTVSDIIPTNVEPTTSKAPNIENTETELENTELKRLNNEQLSTMPPAFDPFWYELMAFTPNNNESAQDMQLATGNYLKAIGRSSENIQQGGHNDLLMFAEMSAVTLPHQRWLLQLAKISEIYLQRNRLRITSEPENPPKPPLVSLGVMNGNSDNTPATISEKPIEYDAPAPIWKNPVILIVILVIGSLSALATLKYQMQKSAGVVSATEEVLAQDSVKERQQQDVAIVMVNDDENEAKETATAE
ncbi:MULTISPECIES: alpha/beta hydrolase family protein [unclassified Psychrobacter]|uniref:hypothetical protein n=1 Tax=unclassified Psychrobacter TaxID=196806 RepID=UPI003F456A31